MFVMAECPNDKEVVSILILVSRTFFSVVVSGCGCVGLSLSRPAASIRVSSIVRDRRMPQRQGGREHLDFGIPDLFFGCGFGVCLRGSFTCPLVRPPKSIPQH